MVHDFSYTPAAVPGPPAGASAAWRSPLLPRPRSGCSRSVKGSGARRQTARTCRNLNGGLPNMKQKQATCMPGVLAAALSVRPGAERVYHLHFTGINYSNVFGTFTRSMSLTGTFTLPSALAPNLTLPTTITPTSFSFNDGLDICRSVGRDLFFRNHQAVAATSQALSWTSETTACRRGHCDPEHRRQPRLSASCEDDADGLSQHTEIISDANQRYNFGGTPDSYPRDDNTNPGAGTVLSLIIGGLAVLASKALGRKKNTGSSTQATCESH